MPGKSGLLKTGRLRSPLKICFIFLEIFNWEGVIIGNYTHSPIKSLHAQNVHLFAPVPFGSVSGANYPASSPPSACPYAI